MDDMKIAAFAGSLRRASCNRGLLRAAVSLVPAGLTIDIVDVAGSPGASLKPAVARYVGQYTEAALRDGP